MPQLRRAPGLAAAAQGAAGAERGGAAADHQGGEDLLLEAVRAGHAGQGRREGPAAHGRHHHRPGQQADRDEGHPAPLARAGRRHQAAPVAGETDHAAEPVREPVPAGAALPLPAADIPDGEHAGVRLRDDLARDGERAHHPGGDAALLPDRGGALQLHPREHHLLRGLHRGVRAQAVRPATLLLLLRLQHPRLPGAHLLRDRHAHHDPHVHPALPGRELPVRVLLQEPLLHQGHPHRQDHPLRPRAASDKAAAAFLSARGGVLPEPEAQVRLRRGEGVHRGEGGDDEDTLQPHLHASANPQPVRAGVRKRETRHHPTAGTDPQGPAGHRRLHQDHPGHPVRPEQVQRDDPRAAVAGHHRRGRGAEADAAGGGQEEERSARAAQHRLLRAADPPPEPALGLRPGQVRHRLHHGACHTHQLRDGGDDHPAGGPPGRDPPDHQRPGQDHAEHSPREHRPSHRRALAPLQQGAGGELARDARTGGPLLRRGGRPHPQVHLLPVRCVARG